METVGGREGGNLSTHPPLCREGRGGEVVEDLYEGRGRGTSLISIQVVVAPAEGGGGKSGLVIKMWGCHICRHCKSFFLSPFYDAPINSHCFASSLPMIHLAMIIFEFLERRQTIEYLMLHRPFLFWGFADHVCRTDHSSSFEIADHFVLQRSIYVAPTIRGVFLRFADHCVSLCCTAHVLYFWNAVAPTIWSGFGPDCVADRYGRISHSNN